MNHISSRLVAALVVLSAVASCKSDPGDSAPSRKGAEVPVIEPRAAQPSEQVGATLRGKIVEKMDVPSYTYVLIESQGKKTWAAVQTAKVEVGSEITVENAMRMQDFKSTALNRQFEEIYFGTLPGQGPRPSAPKPQVSGAVVAPSISPMASAPPGVGKPVTIAELHTKGPEYVGKLVTIKGIVTKANFGILDRNWIHVKDGEKSIVTTSLEKVEPGMAVTATGVVATNRDFGAGYNYALLLEGTRYVVTLSDAGRDAK